MSNWLGETFKALAFRDFRVLWFGGLFSFVAFFMAMIVQSVVAFEISGMNEAVGTVVFYQGMAMGLLSPIGGALADRWPKRRVIAVSQSIAVLTFAAIAYLIASGRITLPLLSLAALIIGGTLAFLGPARQGLAFDLVPLEVRGNAMTVNNIANTAARVVGPAVAGLLLSATWSGSVGAYLTMAGLYGISAVSLVWLPKSVVRADATARPVFGDVFDGLRYVGSHTKLLLLMVFFVTVILSGFPHVSILPGLIENAFSLSAKEVSTLFVTSAVGALSASVAVARFADSPRAHLVYIGLAAVFGLSLFCAASAPSLEWVAVAMFFVGAGSGGFQALNGAVIAKQTEPAYIGRVMALVILAFAGFGVAAYPYGLLADWMGERQTLMTMAGIVLSLCVVLGVPLARQDWTAPPGASN